MSKVKKAATIIVTWNNEDDIADCLSSMLKQSYPQNTVVVVDNFSADNTVAVIKKNFKDVIVIENQKNNYFTGGYNIGMRFAVEELKCEYVLIVNPDTSADRNLISELVKGIETDSKIGAAGPKIKFSANGKLYSCGIYFDGFNIAAQRGHLEKDHGQFAIMEEVFGLEGTCILFRAEMIKQVGYFWEMLKMYLEDVEYFLRARKYGWKAVYCPKAVLWHKVMQSTRQNKEINIEKQKNRNWLLIALRHYTLLSKLAMLKKYLKFKLKFS